MDIEVRIPQVLEQQVRGDGYVWIYLPCHPDARGGWMLQHRLVMEAALGGRLPPGAEVHHRDRNPLNNAFENLQLLPKEVHRALHDAPDRDEARTRLDCDSWARDAVEFLRLHYEDARGAVPFEWSTRGGAAALAARARRSQEAVEIEVLSGKHDARIKSGVAAREAPSTMAAALGVSAQAVIQRLRQLAGKEPVVRKAGTKPRER